LNVGNYTLDLPALSHRRPWTKTFNVTHSTWAPYLLHTSHRKLCFAFSTWAQRACSEVLQLFIAKSFYG